MSSIQILLSVFFLIIFSSCLPTTQYKIPKLGAFQKNIHRTEPQTSSKSSSKDLVMFYYTQTLDHFNYKPESYTTFRQRYVIDFRYWGGANTSAPIFVFFGAEEDLDDDLDAIGFLSDNAPHFKALLIYIEVRYVVLYALILGIFVIKFLIFLSSQVPLFL